MEHRHAPRNTIKRTHANILVSALERQVLRGYTNDKVVGH